jgi:hypothetical protein
MGSTGKQKLPKRQSLSQLPSKSALSESVRKIADNPATATPQGLNPQPDASCSCSETEARQEDASDMDLEASEMCIEGAKEDEILQNANAMTVEEVVRRRARRMKQLAKLYRRHYWALMEELRFKYREYYMKYGKSGWKEKIEDEAMRERDQHVEVGDEKIEPPGSVQQGISRPENGNETEKCVFQGCKSKPIPLCMFCYNHILSDKRQQLYKACSYVVKSGQTGPTTCGKPVLKAAIPSLCTVHFQKAQKQVAHSLKRAGLNTSSSSKLAPKFHLIISEYVNYIQSQRREAQTAGLVDNVDKEGLGNVNSNKDPNNP